MTAPDDEGEKLLVTCFCAEYAGDPPTLHVAGEPGCVLASRTESEES